jgi:putative ABC transport system permease protein
MTFYLRYLSRELRRRLRQALLIAAGLGAGSGLVMTVTAASTGIDGAQASVLRSLYGIGTDLTVTDWTPVTGAGVPGELTPGDLGPVPYARIDRLLHVASAADGLLLSEILQPPGGLPVSITVDGVDPAHLGLGPLGPGHRFGAVDGAVLDSGYAASRGLSAGSTIIVGGARFRVAGIVGQQDGADIYIPLIRAQQLAKIPGGVNVVYVAADSAADVPAVRAELARLRPAATVTDSSSAADAVTGSLRSAAGLADDLGRWVGVAALAAAVIIAGLLTVAAVTRRVREFGTLRALGWPARRIIGQVMGESLVTGIGGGVVGVAVGVAGTALVNSLAPRLVATVPAADGSRATVGVQLVCRVSPLVVAMAVLLAVGSAVVAGAFGAWRAARLQPADAFNRIALCALHPPATVTNRLAGLVKNPSG